MLPYEAAVNMFHREHARWNQWVLFYFGSIVSIFVIGEKAREYVPAWILPLLGFIISIMWVAVATTLRASTTAWRETILSLEKENAQLPENIKVFHIQEEKWNEFRHWNDLKSTLRFWKRGTLTSVTRLLTLFGIISALCFILLFFVTISSENRLKGPIFPDQICDLPKADIKFDGVNAYLSQSDTHQILFMECEKNIDYPAQAHSAQFGIVLKGRIEFMIDNKRQCYTRGDQYYIPEDVKHSCKIYSGYAGITFFNEPHRYSPK